MSAPTQLRPLYVVAVLAVVATATFGLPLVWGLSWWPTPTTRESFLGDSHPNPAYPATVDAFSFAQVDWPWRQIEARQIVAGRFPLWNASESLGFPFIPQYQNQLVFPLEWVEIFGGPFVWTLMLQVKIVLAGLGTYLMLSRITREPIGALVGAVMYSLSAYFVWFYTVTAFVTGAVLVPWMFWAILRLNDRTVSLASACGSCGLVVFLILSSGQPQMSVLTLLAAGLFQVAILLARRRRPLIVIAVVVPLSILLGSAAAALPLSSFAETLPYSYTIHTPGSYSAGGTAPLNFITPLWPYLPGQTMRPWDGSLYPTKLNWEGFPVLLGGSGLLLAVLGITNLGGRRPADGVHPGPALWSLLGLAVLILSIVLASTAGFSQIWNLPVLNRVNLPRYGSPVLSFALASIAAWGVAGLTGVRLWRLLVADILVLVLAVGAFWMLAPNLFTVLGSAPDPSYVKTSLWLGFGPFVAAFVALNVALVALALRRTSAERVRLVLLLCTFAEFAYFVRYGLDLDGELRRLYLLVALQGGSLLLLIPKPRVPLIGVPLLLVGFVLGLGSILASAPSRLPPQRDPFAEPPPHINFLKEQLGDHSERGRILSNQGVLIPNVASAFGIADLASLNPVQIDTTAQFIFAAFPNKKLQYTIPLSWQGMNDGPDQLGWADYLARRSLFNYLGVRYLVDAPKGWLSEHLPDGVTSVYEATFVQIFEDTQVLPRAFLVSRGRVAADPAAARAIALDPAFDLRTTAVLEAPPEMLTGPTWSEPARPTGSVEIAGYRDDRVDLRARAERQAILVLTDAYYPGWNAYIDERPTQIYRVNGIVRGVLVESGSHTVSFRYEPAYLGPAATVAGLALATIVGLIAWSASQTRRLGRPGADRWAGVDG